MMRRDLLDKSWDSITGKIIGKKKVLDEIVYGDGGEAQKEIIGILNDINEIHLDGNIWYYDHRVGPVQRLNFKNSWYRNRGELILTDFGKGDPKEVIDYIQKSSIDFREDINWFRYKRSQKKDKDFEGYTLLNMINADGRRVSHENDRDIINTKYRFPLCLSWIEKIPKE